MSTKQDKTIFQLKVTLKGSKPPIWRRILVPSNIKLDKLHFVIQIAMGWENSHLHHFIKNRIFYGLPDDEFSGFGLGPETKDEKKYKLNQLLTQEKDSMIYEYDFGDSWEHKVTLEKILAYDSSMQVPSCIKGKRACPPEDCGGIWGYEDLLETIKDPSNPEHEEMLEWLGGDFDSEKFDLKRANNMLSAYFK